MATRFRTTCVRVMVRVSFICQIHDGPNTQIAREAGHGVQLLEADAVQAYV